MSMTPRLANRLEALEAAFQRYEAEFADPEGCPVALAARLQEYREILADASRVCRAEGRHALASALSAARDALPL